MVQLTTQPPEIQQQDVNVLLGAYQRSGGSLLGGVLNAVEGVATSMDRSARIRERLKTDAGFDDQLAADILSIPAARDFDKRVRKSQLKDEQTGTLSAGNSLHVTNAINQAIARGVPLEVVNSTIKEYTGKTSFELMKDDFGDATEENPRESHVKFLEGINQRFDDRGVSIFDMNDQELEAFAAQEELKLNQLETVMRKYNLANTNHQISDLQRTQMFQSEVVPSIMGHAHGAVRSFISEHSDLIEKMTVQGESILGDGSSTILDPSLLSPVEATLMRNQIDVLRKSFEAQLLSAAPTNITSDQRSQAMSYADVYFDQLEAVFDGSDTVESLTAIDKFKETITEAEVFAANPGMRQAAIIGDHLLRITQNDLGLEGFEATQQMAEVLYIPLFEQIGLSFTQQATKLGLTDPQAIKDTMRRVTKVMTDPNHSIETRGKALGVALQNLTADAATDPNFFHGIADLLADEDGAKRIIEAMDAVESGVVKRNLQIGLATYKQSLKDALAVQLEERLRAPAFANTVQASELTPQELEAVRAGRGLTVKLRQIGDYVKAGPDGIELDLNKIQEADLSDTEINVVAEMFDNLTAEFGPELDRLQRIEQNFPARRSALDLLNELRTSEPEEPTE